MYNCRGRVLPRLLPRCIRGKASLQRAAAFAASLHTREGVPSNLQLSWQSAAAFAASLHTREGVIATCCRVCRLVAHAGNVWQTLHMLPYVPSTFAISVH